MQTIIFKMAYIDSFLLQEGEVISDHGNYLLVKVTAGILAGRTTAVYKDEIVNSHAG